MNFDAQNILVINLGQIGDVILSLPALQAVRKKFASSKITALIGKSPRAIIEMSGLFDEVIVVDRVELRDSNKFWSVGQIVRLVADIRRRKFDFVIDLHSLSETNLLGFLSGAKSRLFANRGNRSLDFLSNFRPKPPALDRSLHLTEYYLRSLQPLGIEDADRTFRLVPPPAELAVVKNILKNDQLDARELVGINVGAGNPSRNWSVANFAELARRLAAAGGDRRVLVFFGPEEEHLRREIEEKFPPDAVIYDKFDLRQLAAVFSRLKVLIGCDTGPMHLGSLLGTEVVFVTDPMHFLPLSRNVHIIRSGKPDEISVEEVFQTAEKLL